MTSALADDVTSLADPDTWHTGTASDEFTPIYLALARPTKTHGSISPTDVDRMDITTVAQLLGVQTGGYDDVVNNELAEMRRRAASGESVSWGE